MSVKATTGCDEHCPLFHNWYHHLWPKLASFTVGSSSAGGKDLSNNTQIRVIGGSMEIDCAQNAQKFEWKITLNYCDYALQLLHGRNSLFWWCFLFFLRDLSWQSSCFWWNTIGIFFHSFGLEKSLQNQTMLTFLSCAFTTQLVFPRHAPAHRLGQTWDFFFSVSWEESVVRKNSCSFQRYTQNA